MKYTLIIPTDTDLNHFQTFFNTLGWTTRPTMSEQEKNDQVLFSWDSPGGGQATLSDDGLIRVLFAQDLSLAEANVFNRLPAYSDDAILAFLGSRDPRTVVMGIRATAALGRASLVVGLASLHHHPDQAVRAESQDALRQLIPVLAADGLTLLDEQLQRNGGANPLWSSSIPLDQRRQMLRWLIQDKTRNELTGFIATLRAAFLDPDWEVQAGAVIACVRWHIRELVPLVKKWTPPQTSKHGPIPADRELLRAIRDIALVELSQAQTPSRPPLWAHINSCLHGEPTTQYDHVWAVIRSLTEPIPVIPDAPTARDNWCFVPAVEHWLGEQTLRSFIGPAKWIAQQPLKDGNTWWTGTCEEAQAYVKVHHLHIPSADIWECAARGTDARRFPWGAGLPTETISSPWGCTDYGQGYEWVIGVNGPELCGGDRPLPCSWRKQPHAHERARLRPVLIN